MQFVFVVGALFLIDEMSTTMFVMCPRVAQLYGSLYEGCVAGGAVPRFVSLIVSSLPVSLSSLLEDSCSICVDLCSGARPRARA